MAVRLSVRDLSIRFGGVDALCAVSFDVEAGQITGLIGPNGAGKTTCFNCITRLYTPAAGRITLDGVDVLRVPAHRIVRHGIARTFQNVALFDRMTVLENVLVGGHTRRTGRRGDAALRVAASDMLERLGLGSCAPRLTRGLPFGARKTVELARALMAQPRLLLLDEPAAGLNHEEVAHLGETIRRVAAEFAVTVLMVEHHMRLVMGVCDHIVVLASGRKLADGSPPEIQQNAAVIEAYLGAA